MYDRDLNKEIDKINFFCKKTTIQKKKSHSGRCRRLMPAILDT
jgi:hypothetical protein